MTTASSLRLSSDKELQQKANQLRREMIEMIYAAQSGHPGGALGMADTLTVLYYKYFNDRPQEPQWPGRDRFVLSNAHTCPILYTILADRGYFPKEELKTLRKLGSRLQGHPSVAKGLPGIDYSGGSLGNGLSFALGLALAERLSEHDYYVYCSISDGDSEEGQTWEAAMAAHHFGVGKLVAIMDRNGIQIDGPSDEVMDLRPVAKKWRAFGWHTLEIDGHDYEAITQAFDEARAKEDQPSIIVSHNTPGKGISYMEGDYRWHHGTPSEEQFQQALKELGATGAD